MIKPLRKYHFIAWRVIAITLPLAFTLAMAFRPRIKLAKTYGKECIIQTKQVTDSTLIISIEVRNPIRVPNCLVYAQVNGKNLLVGNITTTGIYSFDAPVTAKAIILFDKIHHVELKNQRVEIKTQTP